MPRPIITRHSLADCRRARILLAEDNVTNQKVALRMLEKLGMRADPVANGVEALRALETIPYDLVLMDCQMPEMDGFEASHVIRDPASHVLNHELPIVALTANAVKGYRERCLAAGMSDYVAKPIDPRELSAVLERWLGSHATRPAASVATQPPARQPVSTPLASTQEGVVPPTGPSAPDHATPPPSSAEVEGAQPLAPPRARGTRAVLRRVQPARTPVRRRGAGARDPG